jgi:uncharacterized protein (TIGR03435 family)
VKPTDEQSQNRVGIGMFTYPGGRLNITKFTLKMLIEAAYGFQQHQISGGPRWTEVERFDIMAKPPESSEASKFSPASPKTPPTKEMLLMLQALLVDRFQLQTHTVSKEGPVYALVLTNKGPKFSGTKNPDAFRVVAGGTTSKPDRPSFLRAINASMPMFAARLAGKFRRPVLDQTGLKGDFDFLIEFADNTSDEESGLSLFAVIQGELGLKLISTKAPIESLVIDRAERPAGN